jgi:hypothetical protein
LRRWCACGTRRGERRGRLPLADGLQNISGPGNLRKIDLGFDVRLGLGPSRPGGSGRAFGLGTEVGAHAYGFVHSDGTGMGLLFRNTDYRQDVQNRLALDFQFPGQIINSNLLHPRFLSP